MILINYHWMLSIRSICPYVGVSLVCRKVHKMKLNRISTVVEETNELIFDKACLMSDETDSFSLCIESIGLLRQTDIDLLFSEYYTCVIDQQKKL